MKHKEFNNLPKVSIQRKVKNWSTSFSQVLELVFSTTRIYCLLNINAQTLHTHLWDYSPWCCIGSVQAQPRRLVVNKGSPEHPFRAHPTFSFKWGAHHSFGFLGLLTEGSCLGTFHTPSPFVVSLLCPKSYFPWDPAN